MPAQLDAYRDLFEDKKSFAHIATVMPDGSPQVTPVWVDAADGLIRINTAKGRTKARNLRPGASVALSVLDPDNPYRYVQVRGRVERVVEGGAAEPHIDALAQKYLGKDSYPFRRPGEVRILCEIRPLSISGQS